MNKTIKVIELLNKIANGEGVPKKIKYDDDIYEYDYDEKNYAYFFIDHYNYLFDEDITQILDDEVEIIEDNDKLEKINVKTGDNCKRFIEYDDETGHHKYTIRLLDEYFAKNINKIIDHINKIEERLDEK